MKRITILLVFIGFAKINVAQLYQPFPTDSAMWREWAYSVDPAYLDNWDLQNYTKSDTTILGNAFHKLFQTGIYTNQTSGGTYTWSWVASYIGCYREDAAKHVFYCPSGDTIAQVLYDFNLSVGDTLPQLYVNDTNSGLGNWVSSIDSILVGGQYHKQFHISIAAPTMVGDSNYVCLIEGVGGTFGLLGKLRPPFESETHLSCYSHSGITEYTDGTTTTCDSLMIGLDEETKETPISIFPNPTRGIVNIKAPISEKTGIEILDILGKKIYQVEFSSTENTINLSPFPKGIYFLKATSGNKISSTQKIILQ